MKTNSPAGSLPRSILWIALILLTAFLTLQPCLRAEFVGLDDTDYIINNPLIRSLSFANIAKIFSHFIAGNYHPLTTLSLAADYHFFKLAPAGYHGHNLILHLSNTVLVFWFVMLLSRRRFTAGMVALLFAVHTLHVESVAWVTERKDVLYAFFYLAALISYIFYHQRKKHIFLLLTAVFFGLALLAKVQAICLSLALLAIDYFLTGKITRKNIFEKIPFFLLSTVFLALAVYAAQIIEAMHYLDVFQWWERIFMAAYSLILYIGRFIFPAQLSCYYPYPSKIGGLFAWSLYAALPAVVAAGVFILYKFRRDREILFAVSFFLIHIAIGLQLLPIGHAFAADRFSYVASIGLFWILAEGLRRLWQENQTSWKLARLLSYFVVPLYVMALIFLSWNRCWIWNNTEGLWTDVIAQYPQAPEPYLFRGHYYQTRGEWGKALTDYDQAIALDPEFFKGYMNRGTLYQQLGKFDWALVDYNKAATLKPERYEVYANRANLYSQQKKYDLALADYGRALQSHPDDAALYYNRGLMYHQQGQQALALADFEQAQKKGLPIPEEFLKNFGK